MQWFRHSWFAWGGLCLGAALLGVSAQAEPVRILSWNAQSFVRSAESQSSLAARINSAALWLGELQPDVVLLQDLPDRRAAETMASLLGPGYSVVSCSALIPGTNGPVGAGQMAVVSRLPSPVSWAGGWTTNQLTTDQGGFAFAVLQRNQRLFSVHSLRFPRGDAADATRMGAVREWLRQTFATVDWTTNRPAAHVAGGTLWMPDPGAGNPVLEEAMKAGFFSAVQQMPEGDRQTHRVRDPSGERAADDLLADRGGFASQPATLWGIASDHACVAVDWDMDGTPATLAPRDEVVQEGPVSAEANVEPVADPVIQGEPPAGPPETTPRLAEPASSQDLMGLDLRWWVAGLLVGFPVFTIWMFRRTGRSQAKSMALARTNEDARVEDWRSGPGGHRALRPHLLAWLKQQFIGRLLSQRREMIAVQQHASDRADALGERMEMIQKGLLGRMRQAEHRVHELEQELDQARAENRELIKLNLAMAQRDLREARRKAGLPESEESAFSSV